MKEVLIKIQDYLLVVSDEEIKEGDWFVNTVQGEIYQHDIKNYNTDKAYLKKIKSHLPLNEAPYLEGIELTKQQEITFKSE